MVYKCREKGAVVVTLIGLLQYCSVAAIAKSLLTFFDNDHLCSWKLMKDYTAGTSFVIEPLLMRTQL